MCNDRVIPVVFAPDNNYVPYLAVTILSLIEHASADNQYICYILESELSVVNKRRLYSLATQNVRIEMLNVEENDQKTYLSPDSDFPKEALYRLFLDDILPQYDKVVYLDCDVIVNADVAILYAEDITDFDLGAVVEDEIEEMTEWRESYLPREIVDGYFNSGVLLVNCERFRKNRIGSQCLKLLEETSYPCPDQDTLNLICKGRVKYLDKGWNLQCGSFVVRGEPIYADRLNAFITHFTRPQKPWEVPDRELAEQFWYYARKSVFYEDILYRNLKEEHKEDVFARHVFPWELVKLNANILLYGGGLVGKYFVKQLAKTEYCKVLAVCDKNYAEIGVIDEIPVISRNQINEYDYDVIIIAIEKEQLARQIMEELISEGIEREKVRWKDPLRQVKV